MNSCMERPGGLILCLRCKGFLQGKASSLLSAGYHQPLGVNLHSLVGVKYNTISRVFTVGQGLSTSELTSPRV